MNRFLAKIRNASAIVDKVPPGFLTAEQWARKWKMTTDRARRILRSAVVSRQAVVKSFRILIRGRVVTVDHFAELNQKRR